MSKLHSVLRSVFRWIVCAESVEDKERRKAEKAEWDAGMKATEKRIDRLKQENATLDQQVGSQFAPLLHQFSFDISKLDYLEAFVDSMIILFPDIKKQKPIQDYCDRLRAYMKAHPEDLADNAQREET